MLFAMKNLFLGLLLTLFVSLVSAQSAPTIAFVDSTAMLRAHPAGTAAAELQEQRDEELAPLLEEIQTLQAQSQNTELTAEQRSRAQLLVRTVEEVRQRYTAEIQTAAEPAIADINAAVEAVSQADGYTLVLDGEIAGSTGLGLVIYANPEVVPDITEQVIAQMNGE